MKYDRKTVLLFCLFNLWTNYPSEVKGIIGGDCAIAGQFKYQISLQDRNKKHYCGGGIIGKFHILTAAHCVIDVEENEFYDEALSVVFGVIDLNNLAESAKRVEVEKMYIPKIFNPDVSRRGDIAVLKLKTELELKNDPNINELILPTEPFSNYVDDEAIVAGFGWTSFNKTDNSDPNDPNEFVINGSSDGLLRFAQTKVMTNAECAMIYKHSISYDKLCARMKQRNPTKPEGICACDSGGPLVLDGKVIGVVSSGPGCAEDAIPTIYTRVSSFVNFISNAKADNVTSDMRVKSLD